MRGENQSKGTRCVFNGKELSWAGRAGGAAGQGLCKWPHVETKCLSLLGAPFLEAQGPLWPLWCFPEPCPGFLPLLHGALALLYPPLCLYLQAFESGTVSTCHLYLHSSFGLLVSAHMMFLSVLSQPTPTCSHPHSEPLSISPEEHYYIFPFCPLLYLSSLFLWAP